MAGALRSTGPITLNTGQRHHYYGPLRLSARPASGYVFPPTVERATHPVALSPCRPLAMDSGQVPNCSIDARCPQSPRAARRLHTPVASPPVRGFALFERLATAKLRHEAESGSLTLRLTPLPMRGFTVPVTQTRCPLGYMVNRQLPWVAPFN